IPGTAPPRSSPAQPRRPRSAKVRGLRLFTQSLAPNEYNLSRVVRAAGSVRLSWLRRACRSPGTPSACSGAPQLRLATTAGPIENAQRSRPMSAAPAERVLPFEAALAEVLHHARSL